MPDGSDEIRPEPGFGRLQRNGIMFPRYFCISYVFDVLLPQACTASNIIPLLPHIAMREQPGLGRVLGGSMQNRQRQVNNEAARLMNEANILYQKNLVPVGVQGLCGWRDSNPHALWAGDFKSPVSAIPPQPRCGT